MDGGQPGSVPAGSAEPGDSGERILGAVEGGGSKFVCAVGSGPDRVFAQRVVPTRDPLSTLEAVVDFFSGAQGRYGPISAFGVASFGPLDLREGSATFGKLMATPKPGWSGTDLVGSLKSRFAVPVAIDTDVTAAALAELELGAGRGVRSLAYVTVGTGIGGGFAPAVWQGAQLVHPELGHLRVQRDPRDLEFAGICPFHGDCLEGLASGPAIRARWGAELTRLDPAYPARSIIAGYLGQLAASIALAVSPQRIVFGGGVMSGYSLLPLIRAAARNFLGGYIGPLNDADAFESYIARPGLADRAGLAGAFLLATQAIR